MPFTVSSSSSSCAMVVRHRLVERWELEREREMTNIEKKVSTTTTTKAKKTCNCYAFSILVVSPCARAHMLLLNIWLQLATTIQAKQHHQKRIPEPTAIINMYILLTLKYTFLCLCSRLFLLFFCRLFAFLSLKKYSPLSFLVVDKIAFICSLSLSHSLTAWGCVCVIYNQHRLATYLSLIICLSSFILI